MLADVQFFSDLDYVTILVAALAYFLLGALWYSVLFRKAWAKGIEEMGIKMSMPGKSGMVIMMLKSFAANILCVVAVAYLLRLTDGHNAIVATKVGLIAGAGVTLSSLLMNANWQNTKRSVVMIDAGYQILGVWMVSVIYALMHWHRLVS